MDLPVSVQCFFPYQTFLQPCWVALRAAMAPQMLRTVSLALLGTFGSSRPVRPFECLKLLLRNDRMIFLQEEI
jgi:hypothetical protein